MARVPPKPAHKRKEREDGPRISVNKLAEYMVCRPGRQRKILRDQKFPQDFITSYYKDAEEAIALALARNMEDLSSVSTAIDILFQTVPENVYQNRRINSNIDALETFLNIADEIDFKGATPTLGPKRASKLTVRGVEVSTRPEVILRSMGRSGKKLVGGVKLHFPKATALTAEAAGYVSAVSQEYCRLHVAEGTEEAFGPYCMVIDIGGSHMFDGTRSYRAKLRDVEDACQTISDLWPTIRPD